MNNVDIKYVEHKIVEEMLSIVGIIEKFDFDTTNDIASDIKSTNKIVITGEGSSRIFPAKNTIRKALKWGVEIPIFTDGANQVAEYNVENSTILCASNSGRTKELMFLLDKIKGTNAKTIGFTNNDNTPLEAIVDTTFRLTCGYEKAFGATKSIIEQGLFYDSIAWNLQNKVAKPNLKELSEKVHKALTLEIDSSIIDVVANAPMIYFAGYNDGVAEELTLKTNEILGRKADYLEGTYVVHGVEEIMAKDEVVIIIDPMESEIEKYKEVLVDGVGMNVIAISTKQTPFPTILVEDAGDFSSYAFVGATWNLLVDVGLKIGRNINDAEVARKVGNEV